MFNNSERVRAIAQFISGLLLLVLSYQSFMKFGWDIETILLGTLGISQSACSFHDCAPCRMISCYGATFAFLCIAGSELLHHRVDEAIALVFIGIVLDFVGNQERQRTREMLREYFKRKRHSSTI